MGLVGRKKGGEHHLSKKVKQYNIQGNLIKEWDCIRDIERSLGFAHTNISKCCKGKIREVYGYVWKYADSELMEDK